MRQPIDVLKEEIENLERSLKYDKDGLKVLTSKIETMKNNIVLQTEQIALIEIAIKKLGE